LRIKETDMECKDYRELFTSLLAGELDITLSSEIEIHLAGCADCRAEFEAAKRIWDLMGEIQQPEPSEAMRTDFDAILSDYKEQLMVNKNPIGEWINKLHEYWFLYPQPRLAFSLLLIVVGLIGGYILHKPEHLTTSYNKQIELLSSQISEMKQVMMLSLLKDPSASQRILAVAYTDDISNVDLKVITALFTTLNEDPNVNVRLATLEALVKLAGEPKVREGLVRSIDLQDSPLMQSAIADAMVKLQEKSSVQSLQKLLGKKDLNQMVKINIEKNIQKLI
jgi:HEAT repeats/Putative zinc-finger